MITPYLLLVRWLPVLASGLLLAALLERRRDVGGLVRDRQTLGLAVGAVVAKVVLLCAYPFDNLVVGGITFSRLRWTLWPAFGHEDFAALIDSTIALKVTCSLLVLPLLVLLAREVTGRWRVAVWPGLLYALAPIDAKYANTLETGTFLQLAGACLLLSAALSLRSRRGWLYVPVMAVSGLVACVVRAEGVLYLLMVPPLVHALEVASDQRQPGTVQRKLAPLLGVVVAAGAALQSGDTMFTGFLRTRFGEDSALMAVVLVGVAVAGCLFALLPGRMPVTAGVYGVAVIVAVFATKARQYNLQRALDLAPMVLGVCGGVVALSLVWRPLNHRGVRVLAGLIALALVLEEVQGAVYGRLLWDPMVGMAPILLGVVVAFVLADRRQVAPLVALVTLGLLPVLAEVRPWDVNVTLDLVRYSRNNALVPLLVGGIGLGRVFVGLSQPARTVQIVALVAFALGTAALTWRPSEVGPFYRFVREVAPRIPPGSVVLIEDDGRTRAGTWEVGVFPEVHLERDGTITVPYTLWDGTTARPTFLLRGALPAYVKDPHFAGSFLREAYREDLLTSGRYHVEIIAETTVTTPILFDHYDWSAEAVPIRFFLARIEE